MTVYNIKFQNKKSIFNIIPYYSLSNYSHDPKTWETSSESKGISYSCFFYNSSSSSCEVSRFKAFLSNAANTKLGPNADTGQKLGNWTTGSFFKLSRNQKNIFCYECGSNLKYPDHNGGAPRHQATPMWAWKCSPHLLRALKCDFWFPWKTRCE